MNNILILHACHHKVMSLYFKRVLKEVADLFGLQILVGQQSDLTDSIDIFVQDHSKVVLDELPNFRGTHIVRDPRDLLVSSYFYHLHTNEHWANIPGSSKMTYKKKLQTLDREDGLLFELNGSTNYNLNLMSTWMYGHKNILELRYECLFDDKENTWARKIFGHYGFTGTALDQCVKIMDKHSFSNSLSRKDSERNRMHLRKGVPGDWINHFTPRIKDKFKEKHGELLIQLGYESSLIW